MYNNIQSKQSQEDFEILRELNKRKREQEKLVSSLIKAFDNTSFVSDDKKQRLINCGSYVSISPAGQITGANFCKNKLCPLCQWRLSRKTFGKIAKMQQWVETEHKEYQYIFVTLTIKNVKSLSAGVSDILKAFYNLTNDRTFKRINKGYTRSVEITFNSSTAEWHPHIHMVIAVDNEYFKANYLQKSSWVKLWQRALRVDYTPIIDVRKVGYENDNAESIKAVAEIAKYAVKPFDLKNAPEGAERVYAELLQATYNRRLRSFGGVYKLASKLFNVDSDEYEDEDYTVLDCSYGWNGKEFVLKRKPVINEDGEIEYVESENRNKIK